MSSTDITPKETSQQIIEREAEEAHGIDSQIRATLVDGRALVWRLAEQFHAFDAVSGWRALGYDTMKEYLAQPEISYSRSQFDFLVACWHRFYVHAKLDRERIESLEWTKARQVLPALKAGSVTTEDAVSDVEGLSRSDLIEKYPGKRKDLEPSKEKAVPTQVGKSKVVDLDERREAKEVTVTRVGHSEPRKITAQITRLSPNGPAPGEDDEPLLSESYLADEVWRLLEAKGVVDGIGGSEYDRRIGGLRTWLSDELDSDVARAEDIAARNGHTEVPA